MNQVVLIGRIGKDAETTMIGGATVTKFSLATSEKWKTKDGEKKEKTEWHKLELWNKQALEPYLLKGSLISVTGKISYSESEKDGAKTYFTSIRVDNVEFLSSKQDSQQQPQAQPQAQATAEQPEESNDLPF